MAKYLGNAFSINMITQDDLPALVSVESWNASLIPEDVISVIGHADLAALVAKDLLREVACNRATVTLRPGDSLYLAQYRGPRLAEGTTELPEGASIEYYVLYLAHMGVPTNEL